MKTVFLSSAYLAPIEYYTKLLAYDKVFIEQHDHYMIIKTTSALSMKRSMSF